MAAKKRCPICGSTEVRVESPPEYRYDHVGLSNVVLKGGVKTTHCQTCGNVTTLVNDEQQLLQVLGLVLLQRPPGMKGEELRYLRTLYGMTQTALMRALNLPRRATVAEWEARDRIFKRSGEESHLRLILLSLFKTQVIDSDHCFLTDASQQDYDGFAQSFVNRIQKMLGEQRRSGGLSIRRRPRRKEWAADRIAV